LVYKLISSPITANPKMILNFNYSTH
jgi:hypothetical protein